MDVARPLPSRARSTEIGADGTMELSVEEKQRWPDIMARPPPCLRA
jgi:hypothetical protein